MHASYLERTVWKGKYWYWPRMEKFECASMYLPHCTSYTIVYSHICKCWRIIISLHAFSGCWKWNNSTCVCSACIVLLCFFISSLCVINNWCCVAYGCAVQGSCTCILTSVVGGLGQDWQHWSLVGQWGLPKDMFSGAEARCWNLSSSLGIMNSWRVAYHGLTRCFWSNHFMFLQWWWPACFSVAMCCGDCGGNYIWMPPS